MGSIPDHLDRFAGNICWQRKPVGYGRDRPAFANGLTSYSTTVVGGSVAAVTDRLALPANVTGKSIEVVGDTANENSFRQTIAVLASEGDRRVRFIHSDRQNDNPNWQVQRDTDSWWWNDGTKAWNAAASVNSTPPAWDAANGLEIAKDFWSEPIPVDNDEDWTIRVGAYSVIKTHNFYLLNCTPGKLRHSFLVGTVTTDADSFVDSLVVPAPDPVRQLHHGQHGTVDVIVTAAQDFSDLPTSSQFAILLVQYGATIDNDFDAITYEVTSGNVGQFTFERWLSGSLDAKAAFGVEIALGTEYRVRARTVGPDQELGLLEKTLRLRVDGVNGVNALATAHQSDTEKTTKIWFGCTPPASTLGWSNAMNYIAEDRFQARVVTDEEDF